MPNAKRHKIWNNPEIMFEEVKACKLLSGWLEGRGWKVDRGSYGISTAFEAKFSVKPGGRTICYNVEYGKLSIFLTFHISTTLSLRSSNYFDRCTSRSRACLWSQSYCNILSCLRNWRFYRNDSFWNPRHINPYGHTSRGNWRRKIHHGQQRCVEGL